ncbi:OLC1v1007353C1 [Oldenlandia corymbosa var. corymbosa]|uniref:adenylate dimethylallyltransferase (ADP/ATP-dependent) n=1 Tax=Oldenlandia corymbosa var. corymbosa TaxID=529605 RepID=A0AAV1DJ42_OLDCO|nr:OLC1v1007353C1 [Oldenlandia corymbosa var. corymbosa]
MKMNPMSVMMPKSRPLIHLPGGGIDMKVLINQRDPRQLEKVVVVMGATGTGKSRLSIDLATRFHAEVVNSDKMQVYKGLDVVTNKITDEERQGIPHHLLGLIDPNSDFTAASFCNMATAATKGIVNRGKLPIIVGGSNSFIEALIDGEDSKFGSRYQCCFLWVDVSLPVLHSFVSERVDRMVEKGMIDEVQEIFNPMHSDYSTGIRRSIGVPEFDRFFRAKPFCDGETRARLLEEAIRQTKYNTCKLACRQLEKIIRLRNVKGWKIHRLDATQVFRKQGKEEADKEWENLVAGPSARIVSKFLYSQHSSSATSTVVYPGAATVVGGRRGMRIGEPVAIY